MGTKIVNIAQRLEKLENDSDQELMTLVEILANANFFGKMKMTLCKHAKNGQCDLFFIDSTEKMKIPLATCCRIKDCKEKSLHSHIELSNITCSLCHESETDNSLE